MNVIYFSKRGLIMDRGPLSPPSGSITQLVAKRALIIFVFLKYVYRRPCVHMLQWHTTASQLTVCSILWSDLGDQKSKREAYGFMFLPQIEFNGSGWMLALHIFVVKLGERRLVSLEPAFWLQNKARKTNMGLKLDFPKHCIPSHFTHHCGLQTRIE